MDLYLEVSKDKVSKFNNLLSLGEKSVHFDEGALVDYVEYEFNFEGNDYAISLSLINDDKPYISPILYKREYGEVYTEYYDAEKSYDLLNTFTFYINEGEVEVNLTVFEE